ncbi:DUF459 domain-containing protein [Nitratireductor basaltis]|uniref:SGNH hydrolase-type esterase domain-containing protein n=1 Tax=Nitratireductor basaltis TaxID=472175 RepID=A0A084U838_9HYPH|nr:DUF459 domain-containing protein [Nitratireductor basaltis]KFB09124.1 hypothetical protein EL18_00139 [Nitratireductor basaltis]
MVKRNWSYRLLQSLTAVALCLALVITGLGISVEAAQAQELIRRQNLFDRLFGGPKPREAAPPKRTIRRSKPQRQRAAPRSTRQQPRRQKRSSQQAAPRTAPAATASQSEKLENARSVLVVGDFMAGGLADGLETAYAEAPGVRVIDRTNGSSGFVRDDYYDWNGEIAAILEEVDPAVVVVMIGSNDRQDLTIDGRSAAPRSDPWLEEYRQRVKKFASTIAEENIPLIWTGLPPYKSSSMSSDMLAFNDIQKEAVESVGGAFVDIWEGFVDENGAFIFTGPDMNGQPVRLRGSDGINLTRAGRRKVAFYVEKPLNKVLGNAIQPDIEAEDIVDLPATAALSAPEAEPEKKNRTAPMSLASPELYGATDRISGSQETAISYSPMMLEAERKLKAEEESPRPELDAPAISGRADQYLARPPVSRSTEQEQQQSDSASQVQSEAWQTRGSTTAGSGE